MAPGPLAIERGQPRTLAYTAGVRHDLRLLEVADESMLQELMAGGLCLKGSAGEEAVLCSSSRTYAVKNVETTNLCLLVQEEPAAPAAAAAALASQDPNVQPTPPGVLLGLGTQLQKNQAAAAQPPVVATAVVSSHLELVAAAPRLHQLDALLQERQYGCDADQDMAESEQPGSGSAFSGGYTEAELLARVQCSPGELRAALRDRHALCLDGRYCTVDAGYQGMLLELVLLTAVEHGWPLSALPAAKVAAALEPHGYDPRVTVHCLGTFGAPVGSSGSQEGDGPAAMQTDEAAAAGTAGAGDAAAAEGAASSDGSSSDGGSSSSGSSSSGSGVYALDEAAVCLHFARSLLASQQDWELYDFEAAWQHAVPEGMLPRMEMLRGEALRYGGGTGAAGIPQPLRLKRFALSALPRDAPSRFAALFAERQHWEWEDLEPYVQDLRGPGQTAEALLLKYTRASQAKPTDPVTYSMR